MKTGDIVYLPPNLSKATALQVEEIRGDIIFLCAPHNGGAYVRSISTVDRRMLIDQKERDRRLRQKAIQKERAKRWGKEMIQDGFTRKEN